MTLSVLPGQHGSQGCITAESVRGKKGRVVRQLDDSIQSVRDGAWSAIPMAVTLVGVAC